MSDKQLNSLLYSLLSIMGLGDTRVSLTYVSNGALLYLSISDFYTVYTSVRVIRYEGCFATTLLLSDPLLTEQCVLVFSFLGISG